MTVEPVTLEGHGIRLEPLTLDHHASLCEVGLDEDLWRWTVSQVHSPDDMRRYIESTLRAQTEGRELPFATIDATSGSVAGSTRYLNIDTANRHVEIGSTWIGRPWQRTHVNTAAKYLLLRHGFEELGCIRVELKTDARNERSRTAILRLGAREEGVFRHHMICWDGYLRDTVWFSILDTEWPEVKRRLEDRLRQRRG